MPYIFLALAFITNAAANVLLKLGAERGLTMSGSPLALIAANWQTLLGLVLFATNVLFYFIALRSLPLSVAYPVMVGMSFIIANVGALYLIGEPISWQQVLGYVLIITGITIVIGYAR